MIPKRLFSLPLLLFVAFILLSTAARLYPDYLWFSSFNFSSLWTFLFTVKLKTFFMFFFLSYAVLKLNVSIARRLAAKRITEPLQFSKSTRFFEQLYNQYLAFKKESPLIDATAKIHRLFLEGFLVFLSFIFALMLNNGGWIFMRIFIKRHLM